MQVCSELSLFQLRMISARKIVSPVTHSKHPPWKQPYAQLWLLCGDFSSVSVFSTSEHPQSWKTKANKMTLVASFKSFPSLRQWNHDLPNFLCLHKCRPSSGHVANTVGLASFHELLKFLVGHILSLGSFRG